MSSMSLTKSDWEDWNFIYRKFIYATISSPSCPDTFWLQLGAKNEWDLKIELFGPFYLSKNSIFSPS